MATKSRRPDMPVKKKTTAEHKILTQQQRDFVASVAKGDSIAAATLRAGYAHDTQGYEMMKVPYIANAIAAEKAKFEISADMDRKQVMEGLKEAIEMAKLMSEPSTMIQGWKVVAQMCGYMAPVETKVKIDVTGNVTMQRLTQLTDAELLEMIEKGPNAPAIGP